MLRNVKKFTQKWSSSKPLEKNFASLILLPSIRYIQLLITAEVMKGIPSYTWNDYLLETRHPIQ